MFDSYQEHMDHQFDSQYDDIRERYHDSIIGLDSGDEWREWYEHDQYMQTVKDAGYGQDVEAYEANWLRTMEYVDRYCANER
jgi:hypothetical protein